MDAEPRLLLITEDRALRDDVALIAATVGAALESRSSWEAVVPREWAVLMCGTDRLPTLSRLARGALLVSGSGRDQQLWKMAAEHPGLQPVPLPAAEVWLAGHLRERVLDRSPGRVLAVAGVLGGVGASTVAYLLTAELAVRGASALLVDADPAPGSGISRMLGAAAGEDAARNAHGRAARHSGAGSRLGRPASASGDATSELRGEFGWEELAQLQGEIASP